MWATCEFSVWGYWSQLTVDSWKIAIPVVVATFLMLQSSVILAWFKSKVQKRYIERLKITHRLRKVKRR
jgi:hypothetical protein